MTAQLLLLWLLAAAQLGLLFSLLVIDALEEWRDAWGRP